MVCPRSAALNSGAGLALVRYLAAPTPPTKWVRATTNEVDPARLGNSWKRPFSFC